MYFNYHAKVKKLIRENKLVGYKFVGEYNGIKPALLLFFVDTDRPIMPIRKEKWDTYAEFLTKEIDFDNK